MNDPYSGGTHLPDITVVMPVFAGPALIVEDQTTTVVTSTFDVAVNPLGYLMLTSKRAA
jgi:hypothetical protein